jgi:hypothetical protein
MEILHRTPAAEASAIDLRTQSLDLHTLTLHVLHSCTIGVPQVPTIDILVLELRIVEVRVVASGAG